MAKINILDFQVANMIAAGEVVDRPASVVKELVENSIDAGATAVDVEIRRGGVSYIRVTDNGCGMSREDAELCFLRHATSKIKEAKDLDGIRTLGFRGEVLRFLRSNCSPAPKGSRWARGLSAPAAGLPRWRMPDAKREPRCS